jgi:hypothetical protein
VFSLPFDLEIHKQENFFIGGGDKQQGDFLKRPHIFQNKENWLKKGSIVEINI